jgi:hypothetical protein
VEDLVSAKEEEVRQVPQEQWRSPKGYKGGAELDGVLS